MGSLDRRDFMKVGSLGLLARLANSDTVAQDSPMTTTLRSMSGITGVQASAPWLQPTADLVEVILGDSQPLRALDLGAIEPATYFQAA
jgi:hypothetical protein